MSVFDIHCRTRNMWKNSQRSEQLSNICIYRQQTAFKKRTANISRCSILIKQNWNLKTLSFKHQVENALLTALT